MEHVVMTSSFRPPHVGGRPDPTVGTTACGEESPPARGYLLDNARAEAGERFVWLAELFDGVTRGHFDRLGVGAGSRCWEVGAGGPSVPEALAAAVGPTGHVLVTDIDPIWCTPGSCWSMYPTGPGRWPRWRQHSGPAAGC
ncbi:hypothetical protein GCM10010388_69320 [Streptomyces mauvecolor]